MGNALRTIGDLSNEVVLGTVMPLEQRINYLGNCMSETDRNFNECIRKITQVFIGTGEMLTGIFANSISNDPIYTAAYCALIADGASRMTSANGVIANIVKYLRRK
jgi:hypothetical protein